VFRRSNVACQHLTAETLRIAGQYGCHVAVMPCCQRLHDGSWKNAAKATKIPVAALADLLTAGTMMAESVGEGAGVRYDVRMRVIDGSITPQNRVIVCRARAREGDGGRTDVDGKVERAHERLRLAYGRAHGVRSDPNDEATGKDGGKDGVDRTGVSGRGDLRRGINEDPRDNLWTKWREAIVIDSGSAALLGAFAVGYLLCHAQHGRSYT